MIVTAAQARPDDFIQDIDFCRLGQIQSKEWRGKVPRVLYEDEDIIYRTIRDFMQSTLIRSS